MSHRYYYPHHRLKSARSIDDYFDEQDEEMVHRLQVQKRSRGPKFSPFGKLPVELRDKIWFHALPGQGRIIELFFEKELPSPASSSNLSATCDVKVTSPTKPPNLLFVNQESALETKRHYKPLDLGPGFYFPTEILVDFSIDSIYLSSLANPNPIPQSVRTLDPAVSGPTIDISQSPQLHRITKLSIDATIWRHLSLSFLKGSPNLKSVNISFQKSTLHDIKPASPAETLIFMSDSLYFSEKNLYSKSVFAADRGIKMKALNAHNHAIFEVHRSFLLAEKGREAFGEMKRHRMVEETWKGLFGTSSIIYEVEVNERIVEMRLMVALYPRERIFDGLKPKFDVTGLWN